MISLILESATDSLDLGALLDGTEGVQAIRGLTGAGLPPVSVQWSEGAGDGSTYRGKRVLPRDIDIPLFISSETRAGLRDIVKRLAMILADEATLRLVDSEGDEWTLTVVRTGGGDFIYGVDTDGERDLELTVTLRAGQPFWTAVETTETVKSSFALPSLDLSNAGSVDTPPVWEVRGPGKNLVITSPMGEVLRWNGSLANGDTILIDSEQGTVTSPAGTSRYAELAPSPRFGSSKPGTSSWTIEYPNADSGLSRTNLCANPRGTSTNAGWGGGSFVATASGLQVDTSAGDFTSVTVTPNVSIPVTTGAPVSISARLRQVVSGGSRHGSIRIAWYNNVGLDPSALVTRSFGPTVDGTAGVDDTYTFTATAPAGALFAVPEFYLAGTGGSRWYLTSVMLEKALVAGAYFDGDTTDSATNVYAWTGTVGNSTSTLTLIPNRSTSQVRCRLNPRDWMVV